MLRVRDERFFGRWIAIALGLAGFIAIGAAGAAGLPDSTGASPHPLPARGGKPFVELLAAADSAVRARGGVHAKHARLFLSWNRPWGMRGAAVDLIPQLQVPASFDTLYLCFQPGRNTDTFTGFTATLILRPQGADTLGEFWQFGRTGANAGGLMVQFGPDPSFPMAQPWRVVGTGRPVVDVVPSGVRLRMVYAVPYAEAGPVDSAAVLCLGRVILSHKNAQLAGARQPVCIEWESATLAYALKDEPEVRLGERFVSWNSPGGAVCRPSRTSSRAPAWKPSGGAQPPRR